MLLTGKSVEFQELGLWGVVYEFLHETYLAHQVEALIHDPNTRLEVKIEEGKVRQAFFLC